MADFPAYENIVGKMDGKSIVIPMTKDYRFDVDGMIRAITPKTKIIFLCNPNNPTGTIIYKDEFERLLALCRRILYLFAMKLTMNCR